MKQKLRTLLIKSLETLKQTEIEIITQIPSEIAITHTKDNTLGDYATNIAMVLAKDANMTPINLAKHIINALPECDEIAKIEPAGAGFINFFLTPAVNYRVIDTILAKKEAFGCSETGKGKRVLLEFVSANPTGPLHVGHGRGAAYGDSLANLLKTIGWHVESEYYVNDAGRQMDILTVSIWLRYLSLFSDIFNGDIDFPSNGYRGNYIIDIAVLVKKQFADAFVFDSTKVYQSIAPDDRQGGDKEQHIDALISRAKSLLSDTNYHDILTVGLNHILDGIKHDMDQFGVHFERYFSERTLMDKGVNKHVIEQLQQQNCLYQKDGALWFKSTDYGDEDDRVVVRENGNATYFASDIAYHYDKFSRGFDQVIDILGADHHGYVARVNAAINALGFDTAKFKVLLVQFATLYRGSEQIQMSTRSGSFVTLRELYQEVGSDATRFFYVQRKSEQHMDFDLELAKSHSHDNPIYYIQYAHARITQVLNQASERNLSTTSDSLKLARLDNDCEQQLIKTLNRYETIIESAAAHYEPHTLAYYLTQLATDFHSYYNSEQFLVDDDELRCARLALITATQQVIKNALAIIGVKALNTM